MRSLEFGWLFADAIKGLPLRNPPAVLVEDAKGNLYDVKGVRLERAIDNSIRLVIEPQTKE